MDSQERSYLLLSSTNTTQCLQVPYCDFVVWTEGGSAVEKITVDSTFYETVMEDVKHFLSMLYYQTLLASGIPGNL